MRAAWFKKVIVKFYVALDETQRKRAAEIIQRHADLMPKHDENSGEQNKESNESAYESHQFWA
jgi:hypothetical protein